MKQAGFAAATTLALAMLVATIGTIWQAEESAACAHSPCPAVERADMSPSTSTPWERSIRKALRRTERGFLQMAGMVPAR